MIAKHWKPHAPGYTTEFVRTALEALKRLRRIFSGCRKGSAPWRSLIALVKS